MDGLLIIDKDKNMTSRDVVNIASKKLNTKKIGHTGTLDPIASGVLVLCVGKYTKLSNLLTSYEKTYVAEVVLGIETDTQDITGIVQKQQLAKYTKEEIVNCLNQFCGEYWQTVPKYSAVKINGKKLYEYARNGEFIELPKRLVSIKNIRLLGDVEFDGQFTTFSFETTVSKGTYIRSLITDIADKLGTIGTMKNLRRIKQGNFSIDDSVKLDMIDEICLKSAKDILNIEKITIDTDLYKKISNGVSIKNIYCKDQVMFIYEDKIIAIYHDIDGMLKPLVMLGGAN